MLHLVKYVLPNPIDVEANSSIRIDQMLVKFLLNRQGFGFFCWSMWEVVCLTDPRARSRYSHVILSGFRG